MAWGKSVSAQPWYKNPYPWTVTAAVATVTFVIGWFLEPPAIAPQALRLSGYQFINPLLACNVNNAGAFLENESLSAKIQSIIDARKRAGDISKASTYFLDLQSGKWSNTYQDEHYYPSSLGKVPIMIAFYEMAQVDPSVLSREVTYTGGSDLNRMQDIAPARAIEPGRIYTVEQLIEYMIKYSDNNAAQLLYNMADKNALENVYDDLNIPSESSVTLANADFISPQQVAWLFRILYNATFISREYSEQALQLMSETSFTQGLVAGVPRSVAVSHKLGLVGITSNNTSAEHELHDCGIVYARDSYILCVMTRGSGSLADMENMIAAISKTTYETVENGA